MHASLSYPRQRQWSFRAVWPPVFLAASALALAFVSPWLWLSVLAGTGVVVLLFDIRARHKQYADLRRALRRAGGLTGEAMARFRKARTAWCSRRAAIAAAHAEGFGRESRAAIQHWGYRPWHVFPDRAFSLQTPFLRVSFWRSVLGLSC